MLFSIRKYVATLCYFLYKNIEWCTISCPWHYIICYAICLKISSEFMLFGVNSMFFCVIVCIWKYTHMRSYLLHDNMLISYAILYTKISQNFVIFAVLFAMLFAMLFAIWNMQKLNDIFLMFFFSKFCSLINCQTINYSTTCNAEYFSFINFLLFCSSIIKKPKLL